MKGKIMSPGWWSNYFTERSGYINKILQSKAAEYAEDEDRMHNFNSALENSGTIHASREHAIFGMMLKHWISILDMLNDEAEMEEETFKSKWTPTLIKEKFGDMLAYTYLMQGSVLHNYHQKSYNDWDDTDLPF